VAIVKHARYSAEADKVTGTQYRRTAGSKPPVAEPWDPPEDVIRHVRALWAAEARTRRPPSVAARGDRGSRLPYGHTEVTLPRPTASRPGEGVEWWEDTSGRQHHNVTIFDVATQKLVEKKSG
jgi:hypothetical protein